jgi:PilZ domain
VFLTAIEGRPARKNLRSHVLLSGMLMTPAGAVAVRIRDISISGARLWAESQVPVDCDAILKRGSFFVAAKVVRSSDKSVGLKFYRRLSVDEFASAFEQKSAAAA